MYPLWKDGSRRYESLRDCAFDFDEYEKYKHLYVTEEDPIVPEEQQNSLVDNPILCFIFGHLIHFDGAISFHLNIVVIYLLRFVFAFGLRFPSNL